MAGNSRQYHTQQTHFIRANIAFGDAALTAGKKVGTLPKGCRVVAAQLIVQTAFNAATTNPISVGITALGVDFYNAAAGQTPAANPLVVTNVHSVLADAADTDVFVSYVPTGAAATAGAAVLVIQYVPDI